MDGTPARHARAPALAPPHARTPRRPYDMRMLKISVGAAPGEVTVLLGAPDRRLLSVTHLPQGQTRVYCVVSAELSEPYAARPRIQGLLSFILQASGAPHRGLLPL